MPQIIATPCPFGVNMPATHLQSIRDTGDDLPADLIGECVAEAVQNAVHDGHDPLVHPFCVIISFRSPISAD